MEALIILLILSVFGFVIFMQLRDRSASALREEQERVRAAEEAARRSAKELLDIAMRGLSIDMQREQKQLKPYGFAELPGLQAFLKSGDPLVASAQAVIPVGDVFEQQPLPTAEVSARVAERTISVEIASGVTCVIGFYAGTPVAVRTIQVSDPEVFGLPAAEYAAGMVDLASDEDLVADARAALPGIFFEILGDPAVESSRRMQTA